MKKAVAIFVFVAMGFMVLAQDSETITKLKNKVAAEKNDTMLVLLYNNLAREYSKSNFDSLQRYTYKCYSASKRTAHVRSMYLGNHTLGSFHFMVGQHLDSAIYYLNEALRIAKIIKNVDKETASLYNLSGVYLALNLYDKSLKINFDLLKIREKSGDTHNLINSYNGISIVFVKMHRYTEALSYSEKALKLATENKDNPALMSSYVNIGSVYMGLNRYDEAESVFIKARNLSETEGDMGIYSDALTNLGAVYLNKKEYAKGKSAFLQLINSGILEHQEPYSSSIMYYNFGEIYLGGNNPDSAIYCYNKAIDYALPYKNYEGAFPAYYGIAEAQALKNNYKVAYDNLSLAYSYRDSVFTEQKDRAISELKIGYEVDKKEEDNKFLTQQGQLKDLQISQQYIIIISMGILVLLIVFGGFYFYRQRRLIAVQNQKLLEQKLLQMQLNPHFIFNSLQAIQDYIYSNKPTEASGYLSKFARLMRLTLENSRFETISLKNEIDGIDNYLALQKLRIGDKLEYKIIVAENIDPTFAEIPPMLIQPFVENAVEHGVKMKEGKGLIEVTFSDDDDVMVITITDDGPGMGDGTSNKVADHKSMSVEIITERLKNYTGKNKQKAQLLITNLDGKGTKVEIKLPTKI